MRNTRRNGTTELPKREESEAIYNAAKHRKDENCRNVIAKVEKEIPN